MGVIKRGILGGFSGSVGNVVGSSWKGIATMKAKPLSVANPNTAAQQTQRSKMSFVVAFAKLILSGIIKPLCDRFASGESGFNLFVSRNIALFTTAKPLTPSDLILSEGNVSLLTDPVAFAENASTNLNLSWDPAGGANSLPTDVVYLVAQNRTTGEIVYSNDVQRVNGAFGVDVDFDVNLNTGEHLDIWYSLRRADGTQVSDTGYIDHVVTA